VNAPVAIALKVLCSPASLEEARLLVELGADIIDVKNPAEGSLGAQPPRVVREIVDFVHARGMPVSAALGDLAMQPGTAALAAYGLAHLGVRFIKAGLYGARSREQAAEMLVAIRDAIDSVDDSIALVAAGYADYRSFAGLAPADLVPAARAARCDVVMLDTADKRRGGLFDVMRDDEIQSFVAVSRESHLDVALAGSLDRRHLPRLKQLAPDIIGVRGALCGGDRMQAIDRHTAASFLRAAKSNGGAVSW
jgi:uncharacterized protein (UPF0264 family)